MKRHLFILLFATIATFACIADEKEYEIVSSDICYLDEANGEVIGVFTIGDSLILLDVEHRWKTYKDVAMPKGLGDAVLVVGNREYELLNVIALEPDSYEPTEERLYDFCYWSYVEPGDVDHAFFLFEGRIRKGEENLKLIAFDDDMFYFDAIKIDNPLKPRPSTNWLARTNAKANLRTGPSTSHKIIKTLDEGTILYLDTNEATNGFYKVVYVSTNQEGYVSKKLVTLEQRMPKMSSGMFKQKNSGGMNLKPQIEVSNTTDVPIKLQIGSYTFNIKQKESRTIEVPSGTYRCICSSPSDSSISPFISTEKLMEGSTYEWEFYIKTTRF